ncbi:MAG: carbohydrate-binding module family 20 domain-containing protein [Gemmatimonadaceae bacterium]
MTIRLFTRMVGALLPVGLSGACQSTAAIVGTPPTRGSVERPILPRTYRPSGHMAAGDVFVHLFEWPWTDIASECETVLGPAGFAAVQVSPPQEHSVQTSGTWSERYQPVSYSIARSRSGTRAEFVDMVARCRRAGVGIYVDAVINHMTANPVPGVGSNGTAYSKYSYPGLYTQSDFHIPCLVNDYQSAANVQDCELLGLPDLDTGSPTVRRKIADYLVDLARIGVAGFRIDAAKHIQQTELDAILTLAAQTLVGEGRTIPYYFGEVIDYGGSEAVRATDYYGLAFASGGASDITEFKFRGVGDKFLALGTQNIAQLNPAGPPGGQFSALAWGLMPADKAVVFLENHDTQRSDGIGYRDGQAFRLANVWMLAQPYGYPSIMSSYAFDRGTPAGRDMGPPSNAAGATSSVTCASSFEAATIGQWVCEHRDPFIARMVGFRRAVAGTDVNHWWSTGTSAIAFSRGSKGFVAINRGSTPVTAAITTGLAAGSYCDVLTGGRVGTGCAGASVSVDATGSVSVDLRANSAVAIHSGTRL